MLKGKIVVTRTRKRAFLIEKKSRVSTTAFDAILVCIRTFNLMERSKNAEDAHVLKLRLEAYRLKAETAIQNELKIQMDRQERHEVAELELLAEVISVKKGETALLIRKAYNSCEIGASKATARRKIEKKGGTTFHINLNQSFFGKTEASYVLEEAI